MNNYVDSDMNMGRLSLSEAHNEPSGNVTESISAYNNTEGRGEEEIPEENAENVRDSRDALHTEPERL